MESKVNQKLSFKEWMLKHTKSEQKKADVHSIIASIITLVCILLYEML
ncbi:hypothetical protein [Oceanobacillus senegalensis]|nr:hypothetical protein [Oceanobacillus senegalensis]